MKNGSRDLLVLSKSEFIAPDDFANEIAQLNLLLHLAENFRNFCIAHELIDVNRSKIIRSQHLMQQAIKDRLYKPFVFICNKN
ncbi:hypothetical protein [Hydrotalea sp.]|uniref:hypothetical protein n=1 Tax=Hydrotalea sp. TaxID=2881279 RepID=UPI0026230974|nr:hypothetical protein [Hydrotalea sp.]